MSKHLPSFPKVFRLLDLPLELVQDIIHGAILARGSIRGARLMLVNRFFHEQVRYALFMNNMLDGAVSFGRKTRPMAQSYLEHRVNMEPKDGNDFLVLIRRIAERLTKEESETTRYVSALCKLALATKEFNLKDLLLDKDLTRSKEEFETHLHAAAIYMNHVSDIQAWGIPRPRSRLFGSYRHLATGYGSTDMMELYLQDNPDTGKLWALLSAAKQDRADMVSFIFEYRMHDKPDQWGRYWMIWEHRDKLLSHLITPNPKISDYVMNGMVKVMVHYGIIKPKMGDLPKGILSRCCRDGWTEMARYVISRAEEMDIFYRPKFLYVAITAGSTDVMQLLLDWRGRISQKELKDAIRTAACFGRFTMLNVLFHHTTVVHGCVTPDLISGDLVAAARGEHWDVVKLLVQYGGDVNEDGLDGELPAIAYAILAEHTPMVQWLLRHGACLPEGEQRAKCLERAKLEGVELMPELCGP